MSCPIPSTGPLQTVPHPWARRVGLFRRVTLGVVIGQIELRIIFFHSFIAFFFSVKKSFSQSSHYFARLVGWCFGILPGKLFVSDGCACVDVIFVQNLCKPLYSWWN